MTTIYILGEILKNGTIIRYNLDKQDGVIIITYNIMMEIIKKEMETKIR